ncbi:hypothetical protein ACFC1B_28945, partial [Streptomyces xiamenensis]|uniref:hypothetical protein n=1 Tax=Streptomyces xiamenensis TaxID=408015 RepID=UPI0035E1C4F9
MSDEEIEVRTLPPDLAPADRRERYARAISAWRRDPERPLYTEGAEAVMTVADEEMASLRARVA